MTLRSKNFIQCIMQLNGHSIKLYPKFIFCSSWQWIQRLTTHHSTENRRLCLALSGTCVSHLLLQGLKDHCGRGVKNTARARSGRQRCSGCDRDVEHTNSQWLWRHAQDPSKIKPAKTPAVDGRGVCRVPPPAGELWTLDGCYSWESQFLLMRPLRASQTGVSRWVCSHSCAHRWPSGHFFF